MEFRRLGRTELKVSLGRLGSMSWGEPNTEAVHDGNPDPGP